MAPSVGAKNFSPLRVLAATKKAGILAREKMRMGVLTQIIRFGLGLGHRQFKVRGIAEEAGHF